MVNLTGPSLVMVKARIPVTSVASRRVTGKRLRYGTHRAPDRMATSTWLIRYNND